LLNGKPIGQAPTGRAQQFRATFTVPYAAGTLHAVGLDGGRVVAENVLRTVGEPAQIRLTPDRAIVRADGQDLSFITVEVVDKSGQFQPNAGHEIQFTISGPGVIAAVGNGDSSSEEPYQGNQRQVFHGRALVVVRTSRTPGSIQLTASAPGLAAASARIRASRGSPLPPTLKD
jgi:beta-galactosidase